MGRLEGHISKLYIQARSCFLNVINWAKGVIVTSHIFLSLKHDESISPVRLLLFVGLLMRVSIGDDANLCSKLALEYILAEDCGLTNALNWTKASKFPLQVPLIRFVAQSRHN